MNTGKELRKKDDVQSSRARERHPETKHDVQESPLFDDFDATPPDAHHRLEEHILISQCLRGDRMAFNQFIQRYQDMIYSYVTQIAHNEQHALEITRDVFVRAYHRLSHFQGDSVKTWLMKITERQMYKASKKWYARVFPFALYQWGRSLLERDAPQHGSEDATNHECREIESVLAAYIDGNLNDDDVEWVERHLAECDRCCLKFEKMDRTIHLISSVEQVKAPPNLRVYVNAELDHV